MSRDAKMTSSHEGIVANGTSNSGGPQGAATTTISGSTSSVYNMISIAKAQTEELARLLSMPEVFDFAREEALARRARVGIDAIVTEIQLDLLATLADPASDGKKIDRARQVAATLKHIRANLPAKSVDEDKVDRTDSKIDLARALGRGRGRQGTR